MKTILRIVLSITGMVFAIWLVRMENIFSYETLVPRSERYEVGLTCYFTIIGIIEGKIYDQILKQIEKRKSYVSFVFYQRDQGADMNNTPKVRNKEEGMAEIWISLWLKGCSKDLGSSDIILYASNTFEYQRKRDRVDDAIEVDTDGNAIIHIDKICSHSTNTDIKMDFCLMVVQKRTWYASETIEPEVRGKKLGMQFENNKAEIIMGGD